MDIDSLFRPIDKALIQKRLTLDDFRLSDYTKFFFEEFPYWGDADIIIVGCPEDRGARGMAGANMAPDAVRRHLYALAAPKRDIKIVDFGNMVKADRMTQYYDRIADVVEAVVNAGKIVILLGGTQDIVYGQYRGYQKLCTNIEYVCIDSQLDVEDSDFGVHQNSYNHKIFLHSPNYLGNFTNLGHQSYFVPLSQKARLRNLFFQGLRLGEIRQNLREAEPFLRNASLVSFDMSSVRSGDAPGTSNPCPAGFSAEEICQLARYTGMSNRVNSVSVTEILPMRDFNSQTALLGAMVVWHVIEGYLSRRIDEPENLERLIKYNVSLHGGLQEMVFYKNPLSERWWMEVPYSEGFGRREGRTELVPCSESDYETARADEIPEKWWMAHYKLK